MKRHPGPPKKPSALEALQGGPGKRPRNEQEPTPPALDDLTPPIPLTAAARAVWDRDAPVAHGMGTLTRADLTAFATYCRLQAIGDLFGETSEAALTGLTRAKKRRTPHRRRPSPALWAALKAWDKAQSLGARFGLNPSDRTRIRVQEPNVDRDPLEAARQKARSARAALRLA